MLLKIGVRSFLIRKILFWKLCKFFRSLLDSEINKRNINNIKYWSNTAKFFNEFTQGFPIFSDSF